MLDTGLRMRYTGLAVHFLLLVLVRYKQVSVSESSGGLGIFPSSLQHIDAQVVRTLDALIGRAVLSNPDGYYQVWMYAQVERGRVAQVGVSPVMGESVRFVDGGRRK